MNMELLDTNINTNHESYADTIFASELAKVRDVKLLEELQKPSVMKAAIYLRVSTPGQATKDKASLPEQEKQAMELIERNGWIFVESYKDEGKSGTKAEGRDAYLKLKEDARLNKFNLIVVWDFDRFGRNTGEMIMARDELRRYGVQITSVNCPIEIDSPKNLSLEMSFDKEILTTIQAIVAKEENRKRVKRMMLGKIDNARKGLIPCRVPYGYKKIVKYIGGQKTRKFQKVIIDKTQAPVVQEIFNLYDKESWGMRKIAEHLNTNKIPAAQGGKWEYTSVRYILTNFTYTGLVRWGWYLSRTKEKRLQLTDGGGKGIIEKGNHPIIISKEQFQRVQKKLNNRQKIGGRAVSSVGLLVGIAKCGRCGGGTYVTKWPHWLAYRHSKKDREKYTDTYSYLCTNYSRFGKSGCTGRYVMSKGKLENVVIKEIEKLADSKNAQEAFVKKMKLSNKSQILREIDSITFSLTEIEKRAIRQKIAYDSGVTSLKDWKDDMAKNDGDRQESNERLEAKRIEFTQESRMENQSRMSLLALANFKKIWIVADFHQKKELLHSILEKVIIKDNQIEIVFAH
jgi:site-specific DNA recombinase